MAEMSLSISMKFQFFVESQQTSLSPEDLCIALEEQGININDLDVDSFELLIAECDNNCISWK